MSCKSNKPMTVAELMKSLQDLTTIIGKVELLNSDVVFKLDDFRIPINNICWDLQKGELCLYEAFEN